MANGLTKQVTNGNGELCDAVDERAYGPGCHHGEYEKYDDDKPDGRAHQ